MRFDNPFLTRELRRTRVTTLSGLWISLLCLATAGALESGPVLIWLATLELDSSFERPRWPSVTTLAVVHALGCLWAGGMAAGRVLHGERRDSALWAIRLLPLSAGRLVWLNLWLPIYGAFLAWCAGIPLYVMGVLLDLGSATGAALALAGAGWAAAMGIPLSILGSSLFEGDQAPPQSTKANESNAELAQFLGLLLWISAAAVAMALIFFPDRLPFFGLRTPAWPAALLLLPITWAAGGAGCADALDGAYRTEHRLPRIMVLVLAYVIVFGVGAFWGRVPGWVWLVAALVIVIPVVIHLRQSKTPGKSPRKSEDAWSATELCWIAERSENPLLLRDLRAALRGRSLRRSWMYLGLVVSVAAVVVYVVIIWFPGWRASMVGPFLNILFQGLGNQASNFWDKETKDGTLLY